MNLITNWKEGDLDDDFLHLTLQEREGDQADIKLNVFMDVEAVEKKVDRDSGWKSAKYLIFGEDVILELRVVENGSEEKDYQLRHKSRDFRDSGSPRFLSSYRISEDVFQSLWDEIENIDNYVDEEE